MISATSGLSLATSRPESAGDHVVPRWLRIGVHLRWGCLRNRQHELHPGWNERPALVVNNTGTGLAGMTHTFLADLDQTDAAVTAQVSYTLSTPTAPAAATQPAAGVPGTAATLNASVNPEGSATTVTFVYGTDPTLTTGTTTITVPAITSGTNAVAVTATLTGLQPAHVLRPGRGDRRQRYDERCDPRLQDDADPDLDAHIVRSGRVAQGRKGQARHETPCAKGARALRPVQRCPRHHGGPEPRRLHRLLGQDQEGSQGFRRSSTTSSCH